MEYLAQEHLEDIAYDFVDTFEDLFNISYGDIPEIIITNSIDSGKYCHESHSVAINRDMVEQCRVKQNSGMVEYILAHELVHGYQRNHRLEAFGYTDPLQSAHSTDSQSRGKYSKKVFTQVKEYITTVVNEGQAEFMTIEMLSAHKDENSQAYKYSLKRKDELTSFFSSASFDEKISTLQYIFNKAEKNNAGFFTSLEANSLCDIYEQYRLGYAFVSKKVASEPVSMDWFIENPPKSPNDLNLNNVGQTSHLEMFSKYMNQLILSKPNQPLMII